MWEKLIKNLENENILTYQLAQLVSLSVYIRPEVVRSIRLTFLKE